MALPEDIARQGADTRMGPKDEELQNSAASMRFPASGKWEPGDYVTIACPDGPFHLNMGDGSVEAQATHPKLPAGVYDFSLPDGCTHVAVLPASGSAEDAAAWKSQLP